MWKTAFAGATALAIIGLALLSAEVIGKESAHRARAREVPEAKAQLQPAPNAPAPSAQSSRHVALVIGNADYADDATPLRHPLKDARALADELGRRGFDVDVGENLTKSGMERAGATRTFRATASISSRSSRR